MKNMNAPSKIKICCSFSFLHSVKNGYEKRQKIKLNCKNAEHNKMVNIFITQNHDSRLECIFWLGFSFRFALCDLNIYGTFIFQWLLIDYVTHNRGSDVWPSEIMIMGSLTTLSYVQKNITKMNSICIQNYVSSPNFHKLSSPKFHRLCVRY